MDFQHSMKFHMDGETFDSLGEAYMNMELPMGVYTKDNAPLSLDDPVEDEIQDNASDDSEEDNASDDSEEESWEWENATLKVRKILLSDDSDGLVYFMRFSDFKLPDKYILDWALHLKAHKCIDVLLYLRVDLNVFLPKCCASPLQYAAATLDPRLVEAFLSHGAKACIGREGEYGAGQYAGLPLGVALWSLCYKLKYLWNPEEPIFKLIIILCLPQMKDSLETVRLLLQSTEEADEVLYCTAQYGSLIDLAILLMVAREKILHDDIPVLGKVGFKVDGEIKKQLDPEIIRSIVSANAVFDMAETDYPETEIFKAYEQLEISAISLLLLFGKAGDAIERYLKSQHPNALEDHVIEEVALILFEAGFNVKPEDVDLSDMKRCAIIESATPSDNKSGAGQLSLPSGGSGNSVKTTGVPLGDHDVRKFPLVRIIHRVSKEGWWRGVFPNRTRYGFPDLSSVKPPFILMSEVMAPTGSGSKCFARGFKRIRCLGELVPCFVPAEKFALMIRKGLKCL